MLLSPSQTCIFKRSEKHKYQLNNEHFTSQALNPIFWHSTMLSAPIFLKDHGSNLSYYKSLRFHQEVYFRLHTKSILILKAIYDLENNWNMGIQYQGSMFRKLGITFGDRIAVRSSQEFSSHRFTLRINNTMRSDGTSKNSASFRYSDIFGLKVRHTNRSEYSIQVNFGPLFEPLAGTSVKADFDQKLNFTFHLFQICENRDVGSIRTKELYSRSNIIKERALPRLRDSVRYLSVTHNQKISLGNSFSIRSLPDWGIIFGISFHEKCNLFLGLSYKSVKLELPIDDLVFESILEYSESSKWRNYALKCGIFLLAEGVKHGLHWLTGKISKRTEYKLRKQRFKADYQRKLEINENLKKHRDLFNPMNIKIRAFTVLASQRKLLVSREIWTEGYESKIKPNPGKYLEVTDCVMFYQYVFGFLPAYKKGFLGYLEPFDSEMKEVVILFFVFDNDGSDYKVIEIKSGASFKLK